MAEVFRRAGRDLINLILLAAGTVVEPFPVLMLFVPVLLRIVKGLGIDLVHFGLVVTLNTTIALMPWARLRRPGATPVSGLDNVRHSGATRLATWSAVPPLR